MQSAASASVPSNSDYTEVAKGVQVSTRGWTALAKSILTPQALDLVASLHRKLGREREELLAARAERQKAFDGGAVPQYLDRNSEAVSGSWKVAAQPSDLLCRRVEITGPVSSAKMVINMLSRGSDGARADTAMLDFEDSMKPAWTDVMQGVRNVIEAVDGTLGHSEGDKHYRLDPKDMAVVMVRCRGLHLAETNLLVDGEPVSGGLLDLSLCFLHTAEKLVRQGKTPKYYVPKCEHYLEARWWNGLFVALQEKLGFPKGTLRATFLIETLPAAFQMEEILFEIRDHAAGLNGGRWDKIFSDIKTLKYHPDRIMADRASITMLMPWMSDYVQRMIKVCHARGAFAMGGMSAFTPGKSAEIREKQTAKVVADKSHEASIGHDGCWVSHPYFISHAMQAFKSQNQLGVAGALPDKWPDLLPQGGTPRTQAGLATNVRVGIAYMHGWLRGLGCIAWDNLMEDLATLEISRAQVWQWLHHGVKLDDGPKVDARYISETFDREFDKIRAEAGFQSDPQWERARRDCQELFTRELFPDFFSMASELA